MEKYKIHTMEINFNITIDGEVNNGFIIEGKPIISNNVPIGTITNVELSYSKKYYICKAVIWSRFIKPEFSIDSFENLRLEAINI